MNALSEGMTSRTGPGRGRESSWLDSDYRVACAIGGLGVVALGMLCAFLPIESVPRGDDRIYEDIAASPFGTHTFPFGYRLGLPLLVHVMPFSHGTSFLLLALLAAGGAAGFAYLLMRELGGSLGVAAPLALLLSVSPPFLVVGLRHGRNTDVATIFFMMAATYFVVRRKYVTVAVTLVLGALVREAVLFVIPLAYALWASRFFDRRALRQTLVIAVPAIAAYSLVRLGITTVGKAQVPGYGSLVGGRLTVIETVTHSPGLMLRRMLTVYGPLWIVAPVALLTMSFARRGLVLVALCVVSMTYATDWGRMILLAAPVFYPAAAYVLERHPAWRVPVWVSFGVLVVAYASYMGLSGVSSGIVHVGPPPYPVR